ncbi:MAG TPA: TauD/TfdA family dioxygenase [Spongiibacteraceae bacterium]|nr:TauD/TfdA family dioxygenase [Spongiibacteraceae bacterium]
MSLKTINLKPKVGTELQASREEFLSGAYAGEIRDLLEERGVLIIRGINFTDEEQLQFAKTLGELMVLGDKAIFKISLDPKTNPMAAEYLKGSLLWHIDGAMDEVPSRGSILTARQLPQTREGNTEVANTYTAFQDLPAEERAALEKLKVVHTMAASQRRTYPNATDAQKADWDRYPPKVHPLVWTHKSGRKSLVTGVSADYIEGMNMEEGRALLQRLDDLATRDEYVYSHEWTVGDLLIWDNTVSLHRAAKYSPDSGRLMHRVTLVGEEPLR